MNIKTETRSKLREPKLLEIREMHFSRLEALYAGKLLEYAFALNGLVGHSHTEPYLKPEQWVVEALDNLAEQSEKALDPVVFRPLVLEFGPYGVHFTDRIFGANVYHHEGQWWSDPLDSPVGKLEFPNLDVSETWQLSKKIAEAFVECDVSVPLFGLPTIASTLNVAINLYGEKILIAMHDQVDSARHDLKIINELLCELHRWYLQKIPLKQLQPVVAAGRCQPHGFGQLCGCSCHLLSAQMYRDFIAPLDDELLSIYPNGGMIHLCGIHTQHIPVWCEMRSVRAIQINDRAAEDLESYFKELRNDQIIYLNPTVTMTVERAMQITGGRRLVIAGG